MGNKNPIFCDKGASSLDQNANIEVDNLNMGHTFDFMGHCEQDLGLLPKLLGQRPSLM